MNTATIEKDKKEEKIGGQYDWELGADGKYIIKDVEVFSSHAFGENGVKREVKPEWIDAAHAKLVENYPKHLIPVTYSVEHRTETKKHLGFLKPTTTRTINVNGSDRRTMFGDIVGIEPADFEDFRRTKYPFRSATIASFSAHRFIDLSMLREGPGYYEYPILSLAEKSESPVLAYRANGEDGGEFLYAFGANDKKKPKKPGEKPSAKKKGGGKPAGDGEKKGGFPPKAGEDGDSDGEEGEVDEDGNPIDGESDEQDRPTSGMSPDEKMDAILAAVMQLLKDSVPSEDEVNGNKAPMQDKGQKKNYSVEEEAVSEKKEEAKVVAAADPKQATESSKIQDDAKYAALADRTEKLEREASARKSEEKAIADLEGAGYRLTKTTKDKIAEYALEGEKALGIYVDTYKAHAEKDPAEKLEDATTGPATKTVAPVGTDLPEEVATYATKNPADKAGISMRSKLHGEYVEYKRQGGSMAFERFVSAESNVDAMTKMPVQE